MKDINGQARFSDLKGYDVFDKEEILELDSDIFIPAAIGGVIIVIIDKHVEVT